MFHTGVLGFVVVQHSNNRKLFSSKYGLKAADVMNREVPFICRTERYDTIVGLLRDTYYDAFPVVESMGMCVCPKTFSEK